MAQCQDGAAHACPLYALDPALPVLLRPDGAVQVGWSPRRAVLIQPAARLDRRRVGHAAAAMHSPVPMSELQRQADRQGWRDRR